MKQTKQRKPGSGGARAGAGRKTAEVLGVEKKMAVTIKIYPSDKKKIIEKYGSVQKAVDSL